MPKVLENYFLSATLKFKKESMFYTLAEKIKPFPIKNIFILDTVTQNLNN
jgi:hypothetical protein